MKTKISTFWGSLRVSGIALVLTMLLGSGAFAQNYQNRLVNPGFEDGFNTGWSNWMPDNNVIVTDPANVHGGTQSVALKPVNWSGSGFGQSITSGFSAGENFTLSAYGKIVGTTTGHISVQLKDADGNKTNLNSADFANTGSFEMQSLVVTIPAGTVEITPNVWYDNNDGSVLYVDDLSFTLTPDNLLTNPGFEEASGGYNLWERSAIQSDIVHTGAKAGAVWNQGAPDPGYTGGGLGYEYLTPEVGATYLLSAYGKLKNDIGNDANIFIQFKDASGAKLGIEQAPTFAGKDWAMQSVTAVIPQNTAKLTCGIWFDGPGSDTLYMDDFSLTKTASPVVVKTGTGFNYSPSFITVTGGGAMPDTTNGVVLNCDGTGATDVTACIQAALNDAASQGKALLIPYTDGFYQISNKLDVKCSVIGIGGMPTIKQTNDLSASLLILDDMTGWIYNLHIVGTYDGSPQPPITNDFGHNIAVRGVNGLTISNNILETPIGDNIGDEGGAQKPLRNMLITNNTLLDPWRCNISATAVVDRVAIMNNVLTYNSQYVDPIDIEPYQEASFTTNIEVGYNNIQSPKPVLTGDGLHFYEAILQVTAWFDETPGGNIFSHHNWGDWGAPFTQITGYQGGPSTWTNILSINNEEGTTIPGADIQAPAAVAGLTATDVTKTAIPLTWTAGSDNVGVSGYVVYQDGNLVGLTTSTSYYATGLICGNAYGMKVKAYDAAGNTSTANAAYNVATLDCAGGTNLLLNPGYEQPLLIGWTGDWGGNALDSTTVRSGKYSLNVGPSDGGRAQEITGYIPGGTYILSAWGRFVGTGGFNKQSGYIGTQFKDAGGTTLETQTAPEFTDSVNWQKSSVTFTVPAEAASMIVFQYYEARGIITNNMLTDDWSLITFTPATGVSVDPATVSVPVGIVKKVKAVFAPIDATNQMVTWTSSDKTIATVDSTGMVQGVKIGDATITATTGDGGFTASSTITVTAPTANLLKNPGIEQALSVGWTGDWGNNKVLSTEYHSGAKSLAIGPNDGGRAQLLSTLVPGSTYTLSAWSKFIGAGGFKGQRSYIGADIRDASNVRIMIPTSLITDTLDWSQTVLTFTLPLNTATVNFYVYLEANGITTNYVLTDDWGLVSGFEPLKFSGVGINSVQKNSLKLYPNPLTGQSLNIEGAKGAESVSIFDMSGRMVYTQKLQNADIQKINLSESVSKGSYIVKLTGKTGINSQLLLVK